MKRIIQRMVGFFTPPYTKRKVIGLVLLALIIIFVSNIASRENPALQSTTEKTPVVFVGTIDEIGNGNGASFIGTVRAVNEAQILSETNGRVTAVYTKPGDTVRAGAILASLENASEQASLLQAQGAYEIALASAAQNEVSLVDAQNAAVNAYRAAYTGAYSVLLNSIDVFFSDPDSRLIPGVRISSWGNSAYLNNTRKSLNAVFESWRETANALTPSSELVTRLNQAKSDTKIVIEMVDVLIQITSKADAEDTLDDTPVNSYTSDLSTARATLNGILASLDGAEENLNRAQIAGTKNTEVSIANAQVKQALGTLRSAQALYEKTVFRTPIAGTVNTLSINVGDYVSAFTQVAEVANNGALQISISVGEVDLPHFAIGTEVTINGKTKGVVTSVAPAIDPATQKTEVKIAAESDELTNGSTVAITIARGQNTGENAPIFLPITSVKFDAKNGYIFTIEEGILVAHPVSLGMIQGTTVEVAKGVSRDTVFVIDARGLTSGQHVEAIRNQ